MPPYRCIVTALLNRLPSSFQRHARSAGWGMFEYGIYPLLLLFATPLLVKALGLEGYGVWATASALAGLGGLGNLGMGATTTKFVAEHKATADMHKTVECIRASLTVSLGGGLLFACILLLVTHGFGQAVFGRMGSADTILAIGWFAAAMILLQQADSVFAAVLKGYERFDLSGSIEVPGKIAYVSACVTAAWLAGNIPAVLICSVLVTAVVTGIKAVAVARLTTWNALVPTLSLRPVRGLLGFGLWVWLQTLSSALFTQADRLLIASIVGPAALASYSACTQLAMQVHAVPAAALGFLLPLSSRRAASGDPTMRLRGRAIAVNFGVATVLAVTFVAFGHAILTLWMGTAFADDSTSLFRVLVLAYFVLSIAVAAHFLLLGAGEVRFLSLTNLLGGVTTLIAAVFLIPHAGAIGAGLARICYGPFVLLNYLRLYRHN